MSGLVTLLQELQGKLVFRQTGFDRFGCTEDNRFLPWFFWQGANNGQGSQVCGAFD